MIETIVENGRERERNILFNDALNTFYLRLYGVRHMVKDHSDSEKGNPLLPHRLLLLINSKGSFIRTIPQDNTYHSLCYTNCGALAGTRNSSMGPPHEGSIRWPMSECSTSELRPAPFENVSNLSFSYKCEWLPEPWLRNQVRWHTLYYRKYSQINPADIDREEHTAHKMYNTLYY